MTDVADLLATMLGIGAVVVGIGVLMSSQVILAVGLGVVWHALFGGLILYADGGA